MSNASEQSAVTPRTGKPFTFTRKRTNADDAEFFPGTGSTLHFANRDVDTFTARGIPAGLLQSGDEVVIAYKGTTVFRGDVKTITDRHGRGDDRIQDVTVAGPWDKLQRLVFRQTWNRAVKGGSPVTFSTSRVILGQQPTGAAQTMNAQVAEIVNYAATKCGITLGANAAPALYLPFDEARDITCADAIRRELRFFPKLIVRFDYSSGTPELVVAAPSGSDAAYVATVPKTERVYQYDAHPVSCVDIAVDAFDVVVGGKSASYHQIYPAGGNPDSLDCLHITIPLEPGSASTTNESFKSETEDIPSNLNSVDWWKQKHPRLANVAASTISITDAARSDSGENTVYPRIAKATKGEIEEAGLHCRVTRFTCKCHIVTTDYDEEDIELSMDFLTTDARTRTYTWQTGSESVDGETLPDGLAQALYEQRAGALASEQMTVRLGNSLPVIGDMADGLILQSYDIDLADLTARLVFGRPEHLSAEDMRSLLNGFRQRGYASTSRIRKEEADEDADEADAPGGIPPIASSEWAPGVKAKTTIKKAGANAGGVGAIKLDAASVPQGKTMEVKTLTLKGAGENGADKTLKVLSTENIEINPAGGGSGGGGGGGSATPLSDAAPEPPVLDHVGTTQNSASSGNSGSAARADHVHKLPATVVDTVNVQTITGRKTFKTSVTDFVDGNDNIRVRISNFGSGEIELLGSTPHVDFHYGDASGGASFAQDYNVRIINNADGQVTFLAPDGTTLSVRRSTQLADNASTTSTEFATMGWGNDKFLRKTGIAAGGNITITDGTGDNAGKKVISATVPAHPATTTIDVITDISFVSENGQIKAKLKKTKLTVHGAVEVSGTTNADLPLYAQTVAVRGAYSTGTHKLTLDRLTGVRVGSSNATTAQEVTTATPHTEG